MRDRESVEIALSAAETGHLVLSTLHTVDAGSTINRILGMFPPRKKIKSAFAWPTRSAGLSASASCPRRAEGGWPLLRRWE